VTDTSATSSPSPSAIDVADALLCVLVFERPRALLVAPRGPAYEVALIRDVSPQTLISLPAPLGHAVAARLALIGGLDPWGPGDRLGHIDVKVGPTRAEFVAILRDSPHGFAAELRQLLAGSEAGVTTAQLQRGAGQIGPYRVERELGRGSMGTVYRARREGATSAVALKLLNPSVASDPSMSARFVREGRAAAMVNDPGVVGVTDFGELPDGRGFLVMELVEGRTLEEVLAERGALHLAEATSIAIRIAAALSAAHVRGVVHRDLKPSNIFLVDEGQVKIADFGAALVYDTLRDAAAEASVVLGTPAYMAPEQAQGEPTDERADLYALGCILFRMVTGAPPFPAGTIIEVLRRHIDDPPPPLVSPHGDLPETLVECARRALAKRPEERFRSAAEMKASLERSLRMLGGLRRSHEG
jgi:serine/threonine protein kinase